jgi:hypothetical protein
MKAFSAHGPAPMLSSAGLAPMHRPECLRAPLFELGATFYREDCIDE